MKYAARRRQNHTKWGASGFTLKVQIVGHQQRTAEGGKKEKHVSYFMQVQDSMGCSWEARRRYNEFDVLWKQIRKECKAVQAQLASQAKTGQSNGQSKTGGIVFPRKSVRTLGEQGLKRRQDALQFFLEQLLEPVLHAKLNSTTSCLIRTFLQCPGEVGVQAASSGQTGGGEGQDIEVDVGDVGDVVNVDAHRADHADSGGDEPRWYRADADNQITADGLDPENEAIV
jgi:hypothetical protein